MKQKILITLNDQGGSQISCEKHEISPCLRAQDHGHPPIVVYETDNIQPTEPKCSIPRGQYLCQPDGLRRLLWRRQRGTRYLLYQKTIGALCATDYKWVQQEQVMQGKLIVYELSESDRAADVSFSEL